MQQPLNPCYLFQRIHEVRVTEHQALTGETEAPEVNVEPSPGSEVVRGGAVWALLGGPQRKATWRPLQP